MEAGAEAARKAWVTSEAKRLHSEAALRVGRMEADRERDAEYRRWQAEESTKAKIAHKKLYGAKIADKITPLKVYELAIFNRSPTQHASITECYLAFSSEVAARAAIAKLTHAGMAPSGIRPAGVQGIELGRRCPAGSLIGVDPTPEELAAIINKEEAVREDRRKRDAAAQAADRRESRRRDERRKFGVEIS